MKLGFSKCGKSKRGLQRAYFSWLASSQTWPIKVCFWNLEKGLSSTFGLLRFATPRYEMGDFITGVFKTGFAENFGLSLTNHDKIIHLKKWRAFLWQRGFLAKCARHTGNVGRVWLVSLAGRLTGRLTGCTASRPVGRTFFHIIYGCELNVAAVANNGRSSLTFRWESKWIMHWL